MASPASIPRVTHRLAKLSAPVFVVSLLLSACSDDGAEDEAAPEASAATAETVVGGEDGSGAEPTVAVESVAPGDVQIYESYVQFTASEFGPLVPDPLALGAGWGNFYAESIAQEVLHDPAADAEDGCGLTTPVVARNGFYAEQGYGENLDDLAIIVTRGTPAELEAFFNDVRILFECPVAEGGIEILDGPEVPGALQTFRFSAVDDLGQRQEGVLVRRQDLVFSMDLFVPEGSAPIDLGAVTTRLFQAYDQANP